MHVNFLFLLSINQVNARDLWFLECIDQFSYYWTFFLKNWVSMVFLHFTLLSCMPFNFFSYSSIFNSNVSTYSFSLDNFFSVYSNFSSKLFTYLCSSSYLHYNSLHCFNWSLNAYFNFVIYCCIAFT